jgi:molybdopterin converting factor small subunit
VLSAVGKASIDNITSDDIVVLIGIGTALKDGDTTVEEQFRAKKKVAAVEPKITFEELTALYEKNFPILGAATDKNAKRIMANKEVDNYDKIAAEIKAAAEEAEKGA